LPQLPFPRSDVLQIAPLYRTLAARSPITPVRTQAGDLAWLVTGHAEVKALMADRRLGRAHPDPEHAARISGSALLGGPMGRAATELQDHARMRRMLAPAFSARRLESLRGKVVEQIEDLLDRLAAQGSPADLHEAVSFPLPVLVICDLLGVPFADRDRFRQWSTGAARLTDRSAAAQSLERLVAYTGELVARKRREPVQDVISDLVAAVPASQGDGPIAGLAAALLFAGHETTVTRIDVGMLLLMTHPDQAAALRRDPRLVPDAIEEILRFAVPSAGGGLPRYAQADVEVAGTVIRTGDAVLLAAGAANRDPAVFADADTFDVTRETNPHLAFGHGMRYCVGAGLARIELQEVLPALLRRFPAMVPAVPVEQLELRSDLLTGGLAALPVSW
jgi:pentalenolactone synthase